MIITSSGNIGNDKQEKEVEIFEESNDNSSCPEIGCQLIKIY